jgi:hypothetical protein
MPAILGGVGSRNSSRRSSTLTWTHESPFAQLEGADYSFYDRFTGKINGGPEEGTDTGLLLGDLRFSSAVEPRLELVDTIVNATCRALVPGMTEDRGNQ